jgi:hypothetical protein
LLVPPLRWPQSATWLTYWIRILVINLEDSRSGLFFWMNFSLSGLFPVWSSIKARERQPKTSDRLHGNLSAVASLKHKEKYLPTFLCKFSLPSPLRRVAASSGQWIHLFPFSFTCSYNFLNLEFIIGRLLPCMSRIYINKLQSDRSRRSKHLKNKKINFTTYVHISIFKLHHIQAPVRLWLQIYNVWIESFVFASTCYLQHLH